MKSFLKIILLFLFAPLSILFVILLSVKLTNYSTNSVKTSLSKSNIYTIIIDDITKQMDSSGSSGNAKDPTDFVWPFVKKELTPEYLQQKTETFIDDTDSWATNKTKKAPVISFLDLKEKILTQNPKLIPTLEEVSTEYKKQLEETKKQAIQNGEAIETSNALPAEFDFNKILKSDFSIPVGKNIAWVKTIYWLTNNIGILGILLVLILTGIILLSETTKSRLHWIGVVFFLSAIENVFPLLIIAGLSSLILEIISQNNSNLPLFVQPLFNTLITPFITEYSFIGKIAVIALFSFSFILFIASFIIKSQPTANIVQPKRKKVS